MSPVPPVLALSAGFEDTLADIVSWVVFIVVPLLGIAAFWLLHILPEKKAHKRHHHQAEAIQVMCLMSLLFGGLLWPVAFIWAYTKPPRLHLVQVPPSALPPAGAPPGDETVDHHGTGD